MSVSYGGDKITFDDGTSIASGLSHFRNRIINGAMEIDQRYAGAAATVDNYVTDRWNSQNGTSGGTVTTQQIVDAPSGFYNSTRKTFSSVTLNATTGYSNFQQSIEVNNLLDLAYGSASAKTITVSFWVKSSVVGNHSFALQNYTSSRRSYLSSYTISNANSWEYKTITIPGDTSFALSSTLNGTGLQIRFSQGAGSQYTGSTANSWVTADHFFLSGCVTPATINNATWQVTGVQLEVGSYATTFERRPFGTELQLCQRYFQMVVGTCGIPQATTNCDFAIQFPVQMRSAPTCSQAGVVTISDVASADFTQSSIGFSSVDGPSQYGHHIRLNNFTGVTTFRPYLWRNTNSTNNILLYSAEL